MQLYEQIIAFYKNLSLDAAYLPKEVKVMNPYRGKNSHITLRVMEEFYKKFYTDNHPRRMILGINPGRHGAGVTGLMFTDTIRLNEICGIELREFHSRELSSEFFYQVIERYGGVSKFYNDFYIGAISPLGFTITNDNGKEVNYNYYDSKDLQNAVLSFIKSTLKAQLQLNIDTDICYCLGTGKNLKFLMKINNNLNLFKKIIPLDHPRYIMQYKRKQLPGYIDKFITAFDSK